MNRRWIGGAGLSLAATLGIVAPAAAIEVDTLDDLVPDDPPDNGCETTGDANLCTLREAVERANAVTGGDTVTFKTGLTGTLTLHSQISVIDLGNSGYLNVFGPGADVITISGDNASRIFNLSTPEYFSLAHLTLSGGHASGTGGAISSDTPSGIQIYDSAIVDNTADGAGGGIFVSGDGETLNIDTSTVSGNSGTSGGGVWADQTQVTIANSTISGNHATAGPGGGVDVYDNGAGGDGLTARSSTIAGNTATLDGGGLYFLTAPDTTELTNAIVAGNTAPGGPDIGGGAPTLNLNASFSLIEDPATTTIADGVPGSVITGIDPLLGPLQPNGGSLQTRLPAVDSPVVDQGSEPDFDFDQRGNPRVFDVPSIGNSTALGANGADMGSVELTSEETTTPTGPTGSPPPVTTPPTTKKKKCKKRKGKKSASAAKKKKCKKKKRR